MFFVVFEDTEEPNGEEEGGQGRTLCLVLAVAEEENKERNDDDSSPDAEKAAHDPGEDSDEEAPECVQHGDRLPKRRRAVICHTPFQCPVCLSVG